MSLSPPSSSNLRPAITITSLGRRRSSSCLAAMSSSSPHCPDSPTPLDPSPAPVMMTSPSVLVLFASRLFRWIHFYPDQLSFWSIPSSSPSTSQDFVLPLSASAHKTSFGDDVHSPPSNWRQTLLSPPMIIVVLMFPLSTALVLFCLYTLPMSFEWPNTLADVAQIGKELHAYTQSGSRPVAHVIGVMAVTAIWKHAWSIPGSVIWNVLAGALFPPAYATLLLTTLTMIGSACATLLSMPLAPFLTHFFPRALDMTRNALEGDSDIDGSEVGKTRSSAWVRLSVLRLIGVVPWSGINIACGVCGVPMIDCMLGAFIGCLPWTAVTCQLGDVLHTVTAPQSISSAMASPDVIFKLIFLSFLSLAPILARDRLRALIAHSTPRRPPIEDKSSPWVQRWRMKLPTRFRNHSRERNRKELAVLVQEKRGLEELPS